MLVIGSGPIVIGQACEFDYSGTQACRVLRAEGLRVILVNSNPATIMTDPEFADATYVEPITPEVVAKIIERERPDALLATLGGQTALNCAVGPARARACSTQFGVELIGADFDAIQRGEDRQAFKEIVDALPPHLGAESAALGDLPHDGRLPRRRRDVLGYPVVVRPSFTMGGAGSGIAYDEADLHRIAGAGLQASPTTEVLLEESILGWKEYELELMRDRADNVVVVCSIENIDPMGVHTGDSITVAPALTLTDREYQRMRDIAHRGHPRGRRRHRRLQHPVRRRTRPTAGMVVIEMNPRVSRSSRAGVQGDRLPDRQDRRQARHRLHPRRDPQRHHPRDAGLVRADPRLRRREGAAVRVREVPAGRPDADHDDEERRRGDGDRPQLRRGAAEGAALAGAARGRSSTGAATRPGSTATALRRAGGAAARRPAHRRPAGAARRRDRRRGRRGHRHRPVVPRPDAAASTSSPTQIAAARRARRRRCCAGPSGPASPTASSASCAALPEAVVRGVRHALGIRPVYKTVDTCAAEFAATHAVPLLLLRRGDRGRAARASRRCSSSAAGRTGSGRASSSTTPACTPR